MLKKDEVCNQSSCFNRAVDDEILFVLLGRDEDAPDTIRDWVRRRVARGKDSLFSPTITEALACANRMDAEREGLRKRLGK